MLYVLNLSTSDRTYNFIFFLKLFIENLISSQSFYHATVAEMFKMEFESQ